MALYKLNYYHYMIRPINACEVESVSVNLKFEGVEVLLSITGRSELSSAIPFMPVVDCGHNVRPIETILVLLESPKIIVSEKVSSVVIVTPNSPKCGLNGEW